MWKEICTICSTNSYVTGDTCAAVDVTTGLTVDRSQNFIQLPCRGTIRNLECRFNSHFIRLLREPTAVKNWVLSPDERRRSWISGRLSTKFPPSSLQRPVCGWERTGDENTRRSVGRISWAITQRQLIHPAQLGVVKSACSELGQHLSRLYNGGPTSFLFFLSNEEHSIFNRSSGNKKNTVTAYRKKEQKTVLFHCERNKAADYIIIHTAGVISIEQTFTSEKTERKKKKKTKKNQTKKENKLTEGNQTRLRVHPPRYTTPCIVFSLFPFG